MSQPHNPNSQNPWENAEQAARPHTFPFAGQSADAQSGAQNPQGSWDQAPQQQGWDQGASQGWNQSAPEGPGQQAPYDQNAGSGDQGWGRPARQGSQQGGWDQNNAQQGGWDQNNAQQQEAQQQRWAQPAPQAPQQSAPSDQPAEQGWGQSAQQQGSWGQSAQQGWDQPAQQGSWDRPSDTGDQPANPWGGQQSGFGAQHDTPPQGNPAQPGTSVNPQVPGASDEQAGQQGSQQGYQGILDPRTGEIHPVPDLNNLHDSDALLVVVSGPDAGAQILLDTDVVTVGRSPNADIFLDDVTVSRKHAEFVRTPAGFTLRDTGSLNGTYVGRQLIDSIELQNGADVQIGKFRMIFQQRPRTA
ncbi:FHA domain-containing protein [Brevibacterium sp. 5221]|uniref:FHA domain-containing protein n=1 Tax=Brevibacterium rongguiense TaxID=2695267 RepID=A0A6N9HA33_9MICO|nr:FHA domain-containing protein [Brevibacterium rongguiense]